MFPFDDVIMIPPIIHTSRDSISRGLLLVDFTHILQGYLTGTGAYVGTSAIDTNQKNMGKCNTKDWF